MGKTKGRRDFAQDYKADALALMMLETNQDRVIERLKELHPDEEPPVRQTLGIWFRDPNLEPDAFLIQRMQTLRRGQFMARFNGLGAALAERFLLEIPTMAWKDVQSGMIAMGITSDKVVGTQRGGGTAMTLNINDNRGPRVYTVIAPEDDSQPAELIDVPVLALDEETDDAEVP